MKTTWTVVYSKNGVDHLAKIEASNREEAIKKAMNKYVESYRLLL